jgi:hypothetical protein
MNIDIAGVHFCLTCRYPLTFSKLTPAYRTFMGKTFQVECDVRVSVFLETENIPDTGKKDKIFDSGSWSMFRQDNEYFLELRSPAFGNQLIWMAHFNRTSDEITIYCGDLFVSRENETTTVSSPLSYPLDQLLLMYILAGRGGALIHAAGMHINERGFIFPGRSGAGKSTLSRLFQGRDNTGMLSDDRVVARKSKGSFNVFGTPWAGDAGIAENETYPLSGIFFIRHGHENLIKELKPGEAMEKLLPVTTIPWYDRSAMPEILATCDGLISSVPAYEFSFSPDTEAVDYFEKFISG